MCIKARVVRQYVQRHSGRIYVEWLAAYAPDLNPTEQVWNHTKYADMLNLAADNLEELQSLVGSSIWRTQSQSDLLRSFFAWQRYHCKEVLCYLQRKGQ